MASSAAPAAFSGGCLCRKVKYRSTTAPAYKLACVCSDCQTIGGAFGVVSLVVPAGSVEVTQGEEVLRGVTLEESKKKLERRFCSACGTHVLAQAADEPMMAVNAGTVDQKDLVEPQIVIWGKSKRSFHRFPEGVPVFDEYPPPPAADKNNNNEGE